MRGLGQLLAERAEHRGCSVEQDHPSLGCVDPPEVSAQGPVRQLGDLPGHLHPGRPGADDHEGQPLLSIDRVLAELGQLERAEDPAAQLQCIVDALHARGELGELVISEVGLSSAGRDDQRVVRGHGGAQRAHRGDRTRVQVELGDPAEQGGGVGLLLQYLPGRGRHLALGQHTGRHLVEQRLEQVVRGHADHRDVDWRLGQGLRRPQARRSRTR